MYSNIFHFHYRIFLPVCQSSAAAAHENAVRIRSAFLIFRIGLQFFEFIVQFFFPFHVRNDLRVVGDQEAHGDAVGQKELSLARIRGGGLRRPFACLLFPLRFRMKYFRHIFCRRPNISVTGGFPQQLCPHAYPRFKRVFNRFVPIYPPSVDKYFSYPQV